MSTPVHRRRTSALGPTEMLLLRQWGETLYELLDEMPYLVGSVMSGTEWRDVDVRVMLDEGHPLLALHEDAMRAINCAFTVWGQRTTGLPIDFQFQATDQANAEYGGHPRNPLGSLLGRGWRKRRDAAQVDGAASGGAS